MTGDVRWLRIRYILAGTIDWAIERARNMIPVLWFAVGGKPSRSCMSGKRWPTAVDLFSGAGSATAALKSCHFRVVAAVDNDPSACATYRLNHPTVRLLEEDIRSLDPLVVRDECLDGVQLDLMIICAPCQPFSSQNRHQSDDSRSELLLDAARFVAAMRPLVVFVENVPGIAAARHAGLIADFRQACGGEYRFTRPIRVNAADYAVPQRRVRCVLMGSRGSSLPKLPAPHTPEGSRRTVRQAIQGLPSLSSGEADPEDRIHAARNHSAIALRRLAAIPRNGGSRDALPESLALACHKDANCYPDVYGRMSWDDVAPTLTTGCTDVTRGRFAHPEEDRAITPREAAVIQTFPQHYKFRGTLGAVATQIGNALPFALLRALTPAFREAIRDAV